MEDSRHSIILFPYLKTSHPVRVGQTLFRSTKDLLDLSEEDARMITEISAMLFLQNNLQIQSASYALVPFIDLDFPGRSALLGELEHIQAIVGYCYASACNVFGDPFFDFEHASMLVLSPGRVSIYLVNPEHHTKDIGGPAFPLRDEHGFMEGYSGLYNFRQPFWVTKGSRLYPPVPHLGLNISQDLAADLDMYIKHPRYSLLERLAHRKLNAIDHRIITAIKWFNAANSSLISNEAAIVNFSIAFESLLALPEDAKTDRLIDAVSLLLGRVPRLNSWVHQFYKVRSEIVHEGKAQDAIQQITAVPKMQASSTPSVPLDLALRIVNIVWNYIFSNYFRLKRDRERLGNN